MNENENTAYKMWNTAKVVLKGQFIALNCFIREKGKSQINNPKDMNRHFTREANTDGNKDMMDVHH